MSSESSPDNSETNSPVPHVPVYFVTDEALRHEELPPPDGPFWEIPHDEELSSLPPDDEFEEAAPLIAPPVAARKTTLLWSILIGAALLVWTAVAWKVLELRRENQAAVVPVAIQKRVEPLVLPAPRPRLRRRITTPKRLNVVTRKRPKRAARGRASEKHSVILGRGAVLEDDKSIIRIHD